MVRHDVLLLDKNWVAYDQIPPKQAICMLYAGRAMEIEPGSFAMKSISQEYPVPAVIRAIHYIVDYRKHNKGLKFSKKNVARRDDYICQYCGEDLSDEKYTIDHVVPISKGGKSKWSNVVICCKSCNAQKGDRTPQQAKMFLRREPKEPYAFGKKINPNGQRSHDQGTTLSRRLRCEKVALRAARGRRSLRQSKWLPFHRPAGTLCRWPIGSVLCITVCWTAPTTASTASC